MYKPAFTSQFNVFIHVYLFNKTGSTVTHYIAPPHVERTSEITFGAKLRPGHTGAGLSIESIGRPNVENIT